MSSYRVWVCFIAVFSQQKIPTNKNQRWNTWNLSNPYCWWFRNPAITTFWMYKNTNEQWDILPTSTGERRISEASAVWIFPYLFPFRGHPMEGVIQDDPVEPQGIGATVSRIPPLDPGASNIAGWKMGDPDWGKMYFLLKMGDIPASYVSLPEGSWYLSNRCFFFLRGLWL